MKIQSNITFTVFKMFQMTILYFDLFALSIWYENTIVNEMNTLLLSIVIWFSGELFGFLFFPPAQYFVTFYS